MLRRVEGVGQIDRRVEHELHRRRRPDQVLDLFLQSRSPLIEHWISKQRFQPWQSSRLGAAAQRGAGFEDLRILLGAAGEIPKQLVGFRTGDFFKNLQAAALAEALRRDDASFYL